MAVSQNSIARASLTLGLTGATSLANAGGSIDIEYSLAATAVPFMGQGLLIALGLLLVAIATRILYNSAGARRTLSLALLTGGLGLTGLGVERVIADEQVNIPAEGRPCSGGLIDIFSDNDGSVDINNNCPNDIRLNVIDDSCGSSGVIIPATIVPAGGSVTGPYCSRDK